MSYQGGGGRPNPNRRGRDDWDRPPNDFEQSYQRQSDYLSDDGYVDDRRWRQQQRQMQQVGGNYGGRNEGMIGRTLRMEQDHVGPCCGNCIWKTTDRIGNVCSFIVTFTVVCVMVIGAFRTLQFFYTYK